MSECNPEGRNKAGWNREQYQHCQQQKQPHVIIPSDWPQIIVVYKANSDQDKLSLKVVQERERDTISQRDTQLGLASYLKRDTNCQKPSKFGLIFLQMT